MAIQIFLNTWFQRFARREKISESVLIDAIARAEKGIVDADLGGGVIKQRIAKPGQGKSGGYRTIIIFRRGDLAFFVYGFAKSDRENITKDEREAFKKTAQKLLALSDREIQSLIEKGVLRSIPVAME